MPEHIVGIDVGTGGTRTVIVHADGRIVASATEDHEPFGSPQIGWAEQRPEDWWRAATRSVRHALTRADLRGDEIGCVGFSGQMHGAVLLDASDDVVRPALIWCDVRTHEQCLELTSRIGADRLIRLTCNPALTNFTLTKLLWTREHEPRLWSRVRAVMLPKDYVRFRLTGERATDMADASGTLMLDVARRRWSDEMLQATGIDRAVLPALHESPEVCGTISAGGADASGLAAGTPVVAGAGDQAAGAAGMGIVAPGSVSATIGTSGVVFAATDWPAVDPRGRLHTFCHAIPGRWHVMGVTQAAGLSLRWFRDRFASGVGNDGEDPYARRAILEGVAFSLKDTLTIFEEMNVPMNSIRLGGGGSRSPLWRQIQADVYGQELETVEADEGAAYGAAILAGVGGGLWPTVDAACHAVVRVTGRVRPKAASASTMAASYAAYRRMYPAITSIFHA
jgi:xylulokinase